MKIGILGGGLSALSLSSFLEHQCEIAEKEERPGGLCRTFMKEGFHYDLGGHILYTKENKLRDLMESSLHNNSNRCRRANKVLYRGRYIKYPFENGIAGLEKDDIYDCLMGYLENDYPEPHDFEAWIYHTFGKGFAEKYLIPYNRKIWKVALDTMGLEWVERVPRPPLADIVKSALAIETEGYLHQLHFLYPLRGGIEAFASSFLKESTVIHNNYTISSIRKQGKAWHVSDGTRTLEYDRLVITFPVTEALKCMENVPPEITRAAEELKHNSMKVVLLGVNNRSLMEMSALYIPDPSVLCHRVCFMGYFSPENVPEGCSSLIAEITFPPGDRNGPASDDTIIERTLEDLAGLGIVDKKDVLTTELQNIEYAYVIYDQKRRENMNLVKRYFSSCGIDLLGRFAEFEYINMDEVLRRSLSLAGSLNNV
jgi:protoporphyrinogen oxidase